MPPSYDPQDNRQTRLEFKNQTTAAFYRSVSRGSEAWVHWEYSLEEWAPFDRVEWMLRRRACFWVLIGLFAFGFGLGPLAPSGSSVTGVLACAMLALLIFFSFWRLILLGEARKHPLARQNQTHRVIIPQQGVWVGGASFPVHHREADVERVKMLSDDSGGSIGIMLTPEHGFEVTPLLRYADVAMQMDKRAHDGHAVYTSEIVRHSRRELALMNELSRAIAEDGLVLYYQPKVSLLLGQVVGVEALVRWPHPVHGLIPPNEFIPLAERGGLIGPLTQWVLERAIRQCRDWERVGLHLKVAVNLSTRTLYDQELLSTVTGLLESYRVEARWLTLEVTESTLIDDPERARLALARLREYGISIALDDFGTGYSSLAYLKRLPLDEIKLDKAFVLGLDAKADPADVAIVRAVVTMARPLRCEVVAEGVESFGTWKLLREFGCDLAQGYYLSRPLPAAALEQWARTSPWGMPERMRSRVPGAPVK